MKIGLMVVALLYIAMLVFGYVSNFAVFNWLDFGTGGAIGLTMPFTVQLFDSYRRALFVFMFCCTGVLIGYMSGFMEFNRVIFSGLATGVAPGAFVMFMVFRPLSYRQLSTFCSEIGLDGLSEVLESKASGSVR